MDIASALVGGGIGIASSAATAYCTYLLTSKESYRHELASAYSIWTGRLVEALDEWTHLMQYDEIQKYKDADKSGALRDIKPNAAGRPREEIVKRMLETRRDLQIATSNLLMLESAQAFSDRIKSISTLMAKESDEMGYFKFEQKKKADMNGLLEEICVKHPVLGRHKK
jgi:hypothetical protein